MAAINDVLSTIKRFGREEIESSTPAKNGPSIQANCPEVASRALTRTNRFFGNNMGIKELKAGWNRVLKQLLKKTKNTNQNIKTNTNEEKEAQEPEMFEDSDLEKNFEIPAFLRRQKN